ncbi:unnamed protein product [Prorocentrum cordatum]|uniref:EF-hand domain-containing protein n=1 Tax=Prorocentrum cordatum TaxID=2364126 RepID=A0ABN9Y2D5_9DINO|nr:unnamed protein product [Polarella glacialis]
MIELTLEPKVTRLIPDVERLQESCDKVLADRSAFDSWQQRLAACEGAARRAHSADQRLDELRRLVEQTAGEHGRRLNECLGEVGHCRGRISAVEDSVKRLDKSLRIAEQRQLGWDQCRKRDQRDLDLLLDGLQRRLEDAEAQNQHGLQGLLRHLQQPAAALCGRLRGGPSRAGAPAGGLSVRAAATASGVIAPARAPRGPAAGSPAARRGGRAAVVVEQSSFGESSRSLLLAPRGARAAGAVEQGSPGESSRSFLLAPRGERAASPAAARGADAGEQARRRLIGRLFDALDRDGNGLLDQREMEWFARQAGFEGSSEEWAREFRLLCAGTVPAGLKLERFRAMVDEQTVDAGGRLFRGRWFCSHEEICRLLSEPAPAQHSPSRGEGPLLRHGEGGVEPPLLHEANGPRSVGGLDADAQSADAAGRILVQMPRTPQQASARTLLQTPGTTPRAERPGPASGASPARSSFFSEAPRRGCPGAAGLLAGLAAADQASGGQPSESEEEDGHGPPESQGPRASGGDVTVTQPGFSFGAPPGAAAGAWRGAGPEEGAREAGALPRSGPGEELAAHAGRGGEGEGAGGEGSAGSERRLEETGSMGSGAWDDPDSQGDDLSPIAPLSLQVQPPMDEEEEQADSEIAPAAPARWPTDLPRESDSEGEEEQADSEIAPAAPARWPTDLPRESDSEGEDEEPGVLVESIRAPVPRALGRPAAAGPAGGIPAGAARERAALPQGIVRVAPPPLVARPSEEEEEEEEAKEAAPGLAAEAGAEEAVVASPPGSGSSSGHSLDIGVLDDDIEL